MLESLTSLAYGFNIALQPQNLLYCFIGVTMGTLVGVLPGIGPTATIALLLPATFKLNPISAIIMLSGICYGAMYGGSTTSILLNIPGEASSVVTCLDGYQMARKGRAGPALGISAFGSFIAGTFSIVGLVIFAPTLADFALKFGPPEYFALMVMGLSVVAYLARKSMAKALMMAVFGIVLGCVGLDPITATPRFTFGILDLADGIGIAPVVMGLFGIAEVLENLGVLTKAEVFAGKIKGLFPDREDWRRSIGPIARGSLLGFFLGLLPGVGAIVPQFLSYALEKKLSRHPERFGSGEIEGVASPEACNNAAVGGTFIPLLKPRHSLERHDRDSPGGPDDLRLDSGALADQELAGSFLGRDREHVYRQHHALDPQPAADSHVGECLEDPLLLSFLLHYPFLLDRRL